LRAAFAQPDTQHIGSAAQMVVDVNNDDLTIEVDKHPDYIGAKTVI
jgi:hypothetical protein